MDTTEMAAALASQRAELTAYRTILQNLLLEVARETGAEKLNAIREAALGAISAIEAAPESELTRHQSAALVHACFDTVAAQAGFTRTGARDVH